jgi:hypothetical protein
MLEDISTDLLWFIGGYFFTLLGLVCIASYYRQPELIIKGSIAYAVIWATAKIAIHAVLLAL